MAATPRAATSPALLRAFAVLLALAGAAGLVAMTYQGWAPQDPVWRAPLDYPNEGAYADLDPATLTPAQVCGTCHTQHFEEWKQSAMGRSSELSAFLIGLYRTSLDLRGAPAEDVAQCLHCHAPASVWGQNPDLDMGAAMSGEGVTCDICHTATHAWPDDAPGQIQWDPAGPKRGPLWGSEDVDLPEGEVAATSPFHATKRSDLHIGNSDLCGACHMSLWPTNALPIDWTWAEWARSPYPAMGKGCPQCHMPTYEGKAAPGSPFIPDQPEPPVRTLHRHDFPGANDVEFVKTTCSLELKSIRHFAGHEVAATVENINAGHSFPTGNATAPVVSLEIEATNGKGDVVFADKREYRLVYVDRDGVPTTDPTAAFKVGEDSTLQPLEPEHEHFFIAEHLGAARVTAKVVYRRWSEEVVNNHGALVKEFLGRYLKEGVRLHRLPAHLDKLDPSVLGHVRKFQPIVVTEATIDLPPPKEAPL